MAKGGTYGINTVTLAPTVSGGAYPSSWTGTGTFSFKAIVRDSVSFNDAAPSENDLYIEEADDIYATLKSDEGSKGFTLDTYDLSEDSYKALAGYTEVTEGTGNDAVTWYAEPTKQDFLIKAVQIVTRKLDDFPSKTFQWAKMKISVTKAGTIGKSGFPNFHLEFKQLANTNASGTVISGARWKLTPSDETPSA